MKGEIKPGITGEKTVTITKEMCITHLGEGFEPVFSTPFMIGLMEDTSMDSVHPYLEPNERTVGVKVSVSHIAPTTIGMEVTARTKLVAVSGRRLTFEVEAHNEKGKIGEGTHERVIIDVNRFVGKG